MKKWERVIVSLVIAVCLASSALLCRLPTATAADNTAPRVTYQIVSNSPTPTISKGSSFEANFAFFDDSAPSVGDINITVTSPNGSIANLPKNTFTATGQFTTNSSTNTTDAQYYLNIPEANMKYVGNGPAVLKFKIEYTNKSETYYVQKTIIECQPTPTASGTGKSDLTLQSYNVDRTGIKEGERFNLNLVLKNNNDISNNHVTAVLDGLSSDEITVDGQLDTKTIDTMESGATASISLPMICNPKMASKNYIIKIQLSSDEAPTPITFNAFVPVSGSKSATESGSDKPSSSKPLIIIENYDYGGKPVTGGKDFNLVMHFKNTNTTTQIENLKITISSVAGTDDKSVAGAFTPAKSSNTFFIAKVGPGSSFSEQIALIPKVDATPNSYGVSIAFKYESVLDNKRETIESTETISIPLTQPDRFEANDADLQSPIFLGQPGQLNINYVNKGKSKIFNLAVKLAGNFTTGESNSYIGNIESGIGDTFQATLTPSAEGTLKGTATFSYEDANGTTKTVVKEFSAQVSPMDISTDGGEIISKPETTPQHGGSAPWMIWLYFVGAILISVIILIVILKKKKAKKLRLLADSDDYENAPADEENQK